MSLERKTLQVVNLSPDESAIEKIVEVHPMKQVAIMSVVQVLVFGVYVTCILDNRPVRMKHYIVYTILSLCMFYIGTE